MSHYVRCGMWNKHSFATIFVIMMFQLRPSLVHIKMPMQWWRWLLTRLLETTAIRRSTCVNCSRVSSQWLVQPHQKEKVCKLHPILRYCDYLTIHSWHWSDMLEGWFSYDHWTVSYCLKVYLGVDYVTSAITSPQY